MLYKKITAFLLCIIFLCLSIPAQACTIFSAKDGNTVLVGNNEDWFDKDTYVWFIPAVEGRHGRVLFGYETASTEGGMNDQGLFFDWVAKGSRNDTMPSLPGRIDYSGSLSEYILETCSNVAEAIKVYDTYNEYVFGYATIFLSDKSGASATVTWDKDKQALKIDYKTGKYQVLGYGDGIVQPLLDKAQGISIDLYQSILEASIQGDITQYSNIYDLVNGDVYVYNQRNFYENVKFNLSDELSKGKHMYYIPDLFPDQKPGTYDQITRRSTITDSGLVTMLMIAIILSLYLLIIILICVTLGIIRRRKKTNKTGVIPTILAHLLGVFNSLLALWVIYIIYYHGSFIVRYGLDIYMPIARFIPITLMVLFIGQLVFAIVAWIKKYWSIFIRILYSIVTILVLLGLYNLYTLNLLF